ncbi:putative T7SS-secreted protein [Haloechinothrix salitolerans]|uniref:T7SS-secreted protein n=1 Tax=Haloechinothrix salitolerans TaxID=926830 RepID=A0ABW2C6F3_9PSEU
MAAELGQTTDPTALIPGQPEQISNDLREMVGIITNLSGVSDGLGGIDPLDWTGEASTAFRNAFAQEPPKWLQAIDQLGGGSERLADFADTLTWAQGEAQRAIEMYTEAQAASRAAAAEYNVLAQAAQAAGEMIGAFVDPAQGAVEEAQAVLSNAREELAAVGGVVAGALGMEPDGEGGFSHTLGERGFGADNRRLQTDPVTGEQVDPGGWQRGPGGRSFQREWGQGSGGLFDLDGVLEQFGIDVPSAEWSGEATAEVWKGDVEGEFDAGWVDGSGTASASALGAGAEAHASASLTGVSAGASAEAYLAKANAEGELNFGDHASVAGQGEVFVGAEAYADGSIGLTGAQGEGGAFVGGRAVGEASAEVGGLGAGVTGEAWAGAGAEVGGQFGMGEDGKFHIGAEAGIGLGYGAKLGFDVSVDPGEVVDTVSDVASDVGDVASDIGGAVSDGVGAVGNVLGF